MKAVGVHVFAGGFTMGVKEVVEVDTQLETHGFGLETAREVAKVDTINVPADKWPDSKGCSWCFGNPRCTGFSTITAGYGEDCHGPWAKQTQDIHDLCEYGIRQNFEVIVWESVQQAWSVGRPLLKYLVNEKFVPAGYRVAHLFLNAASFGNPQQRKRYFFVAYKGGMNFNITPPAISAEYPVMWDVYEQLADRETHPMPLCTKNVEYDFDTYQQLTPDEIHCVKNLPNGWDLNNVGRNAPWLLSEKFQRCWNTRTSDMPFSMHGVVRMNALRPHPTIHSSAARFIHPEHHRPATVGELAWAMGWNDIPRGDLPIPQIAKGVCPEVGVWLAEQVKLYLEGHWGQEDWESSYDDRQSKWVGRDCEGSAEKIFDLTKYVGKKFRPERRHQVPQPHRFNVERDTGELLEPWERIDAKRKKYARAAWLPRVSAEPA